MGITVGSTTFQEALTIVQKLKAKQQDISALDVKADRISFSLNTLNGEGASPTPIRIFFENGIVRSVSIGE